MSDSVVRIHPAAYRGGGFLRYGFDKILDMLKLLGNCSRKVNYEYTEENVKKIFNDIEKEVKATKNRFLGVDDKNEKFILE